MFFEQKGTKGAKSGLGGRGWVFFTGGKEGKEDEVLCFLNRRVRRKWSWGWRGVRDGDGEKDSLGRVGVAAVRWFGF